jgi:hypothetical protein
VRSVALPGGYRRSDAIRKRRWPLNAMGNWALAGGLTTIVIIALLLSS